MSKKTAVGWLMEQITYKTDDGEIRNAFTDTVDLSEYFNQAKQMEKEQHEMTFHEALNENSNRWFEKYYDETFKNS